MRTGTECHKWTRAERDRLAEVAPGRSHDEIREIMTDEFGDHFGGKRIAAALKRYGIKTGRTGRFEKGCVPPNKGKSWDEFMSPEGQERSRATCFKPGNMPHNGHQPIGTERVNRDGYVEVKVAERKTDPRSAHDNWRPKHHLVYEESNGAVPEGCNVVFADRDRSNFDPGNLVAVPRDLWAVIAHEQMAYHDAESLEVCMNLARLKKALHAKRMFPRRCVLCDEIFEPRFANQIRCDFCMGAKVVSE